MKPKELFELIASFTQDVDFEYAGVPGSICPFQKDNIALSWGDAQVNAALDSVMSVPFIMGKSLSEISPGLHIV